MCGEHSGPCFQMPRPPGSSPHVRGALLARHVVVADDGIIPACAGSTLESLTLLDSPLGSSPHVRGAHRSESLRARTPGIIPACAGSTCGLRFCISSTSGSSPHVRGARGDHSNRRVVVRDHPRMCGEHHVVLKSLSPLMGSSPHVRGALLKRLGLLHGVGIIPACAGSTRGPSRTRRAPRDHPRMCGEHYSVYLTCASYTRSSPHVRGALNEVKPRDLVQGIIPACAGSTWHPTLRVPARRDHPRMCGEHLIDAIHANQERGSSPHVRGAPGTAHERAPRGRDHPRMYGEH